MATKKKMLQAAAGVGGEPEGAWDLSYAYYDPPVNLTWNVSTIQYLLKQFSVASQETSPQGVSFKPDGTKMYVIGESSDAVNEYNLSTAWDITTASYSQNFSVSSQETAPSDVFFKPDGTKMYVVGYVGRKTNEYTLSTAWDVSTASYTRNFNSSAQDLSQTSVFFKPDGTKMYILGLFNDKVYEYDLSTAWNVSTATFSQNFSVSPQDSNPDGLFFKPDGTKMFVLGGAGKDVNEYNLSTAWDISTAVFLRTSVSLNPQDTFTKGIFFDPDGTRMYMVGSTGDRVYQYSLGGFSVTTQETVPTGLFFKPEGDKMYIVGSTGDDVNEYNLGQIPPFDTSTAVFVQSFSVAAQDATPQNLFFKPDGTKMYTLGAANNRDVSEYDLSTAWNISTASHSQNFSVNPQEVSPKGVFFKPDGTKMYITGTSGDDVNEYDLSTAWNVSTATFSQNFSVSPQEASPQDLFFKTDGTKMYILGGAGDDVNEYDLSTAWDVTSASFSRLFSVRGQATAPTGVFFKPDGVGMFIVGSTSDKVYTYSLGVPE